MVGFSKCKVLQKAEHILDIVIVVLLFYQAKICH